MSSILKDFLDIKTSASCYYTLTAGEICCPLQCAICPYTGVAMSGLDDTSVGIVKVERRIPLAQNRAGTVKFAPNLFAEQVVYVTSRD